MDKKLDWLDCNMVEWHYFFSNEGGGTGPCGDLWEGGLHYSTGISCDQTVSAKLKPYVFNNKAPQKNNNLQAVIFFPVT